MEPSPFVLGVLVGSFATLILVEWVGIGWAIVRDLRYAKRWRAQQNGATETDDPAGPY